MSKNADTRTNELVRAARQTRRNAHAPYSGFKVGAAVLSTKGGVFVGANVENASYPEGICAEGAAISAMVAAGHKKIAAIAVSAEPSVSPCGGCRQKIAEFAEAGTVVILTGSKGKARRIETAAGLLPYAFKSID